MGGKRRQSAPHWNPDPALSHRERLELAFGRYLADSLTAAGFALEHTRGPPPRPDLVARSAHGDYVFAIKTASVVRSAELRASLAGAILEATAWGRGRRASPVAVVVAPRFSSRTIADLEAYRGQVAADVPLILLGYDTPPRVFSDARLASALLHARPLVSAPRPAPAARSAAMFSDLNSWMLKILLAPAIDPALLRAPRTPVSSSMELAQVAAVSQPSAWRLLRTLDDQGYLQRSPHLQVRRVEDLLERWAQQYSRPKETRAVWLLPRGDHVAQLEAVLHGGEARSPAHRGRRRCVALFTASAALGLGHTRGTAPHLYLENLTDMSEIGLTAATAGEQPHVVVWCPTTPESVFRAMVSPGGIPTADVIQCWLDARNHRARGREQADYLWANALSNLRRGT